MSELGNLILLPMDINAFVDNKNWPAKFIHYSHVGVRTVDELKRLSDSAEEKGDCVEQKSDESPLEGRLQLCRRTDFAAGRGRDLGCRIDQGAHAANQGNRLGEIVWLVECLSPRHWA